MTQLGLFEETDTHYCDYCSIVEVPIADIYCEQCCEDICEYLDAAYNEVQW